jgi:hypothetical protein
MPRLSIFDVPKASEATAATAVERTLAAFPVLRRVYDAAFVTRLTRWRVEENTLLLRLMQPDDEIAKSFWSSVVSDFDDVGIEAAVSAFTPPMRDFRNRKRLQSWRTELWFAAWLSRKKVLIDLEPSVGSNRAEFRAHTAPITWWEIKTPLDAKQPRDDEAVQLEIQKRLHEIPEPFELVLRKFNLKVDDVPKAVKAVRSQLASFAETGGRLPRYFTAHGLKVQALRRSEGPGGLVGSIGKGYLFRGEHAKVATEHIREAARQLPADAAGVVVIDCSNAQFLDENDVEDACYGASETVYYRGGGFSERRTGGLFNPRHHKRISAVVAYNRNFVRHDHGYGYDIAMLHNPYANVPIPPGTFDYPDVRHGRIVRRGAKSYYELGNLPKDQH